MDLIDIQLAELKIRYLDLDNLFHGKLDMKKGNKRLIDTINIYISFQSLYNKFRRPHYEKRFENLTKKELKSVYRQCIAEFINIAAHYRKYFNYHKIKTNIIFFYNEITDDYITYNNSALCSEYRNHWFDSIHNLDRWAINNLVIDSIPFMKIICDYLEDVYMVGTKRVESSIIPYIFTMENTFPANMNMLVTSDSYDYNYSNYNFLVVTKYAGQPILMTKKNLMPFVCWKLGNEFEPKRKINSYLYSFILSCIGEKERSIPKAFKGMGFRKVYKNLEALYDAGYIFDENLDTMNIENLLHVLNNQEFKILTHEQIASSIMSNYNVIDYTTQYKQVNKTQKKDLEKQIINKTDPEALVEINDKYFSDHPIRLIELNQYENGNILKSFGDEE